MSWISTPPLVSAVCNAGGCGVLATGPLSPTETRESIREVRRRLNDEKAPFGVGITLLMPGAKENAQVALEERVPVVNVSLGRPSRSVVDAVHGYGGVVVSTVTNLAHAAAAIESGADALLVVGHEAAAHGGERTSLVSVPEIAAAFPDAPIVAAGGIANGRGVLAALSLGADGVAVGSRSAVTRESPLAENVKEALSRSDATETLFGDNFDGIPARVLRTKVSERAMARRPFWPVTVYRAFRAARTMGIPLWKVLPGLATQWDKMYAVAQFGAVTDSLVKATVHGDLDEEGVQFMGQCVGLIRDVPSVEEMIQRMVAEMEDAHRKNDFLFGDHNRDSSHQDERERFTSFQ